MGIVKIEDLKELIIEIRGQSVLLDSDVAELYGVETKRVNEAVKNNPDKFPQDYMFDLSEVEFADLRSKISTAKLSKTEVLKLLTSPPNISILVQFLNSSSKLPHRLPYQKPMCITQDSSHPNVL